ncbi:oxygen-insensitive NADPH nitroreductase [Salinibacillus xinjiangensis]|uniref:Oxygen-insensitive NADPH nitroreductase n=1 Tax=Salinibacillus xinjiangensis TaxID=1229268 RepID=A0A6G1X3U5_9BACI|nr:oxygen-insensitive NADPH nitroreductase [Salinibacillus xinjiangensis]MRG85617.1 oxygen-insensitive NADPH nitroreductase [Salinibacillus xinjiangensis]
MEHMLDVLFNHRSIRKYKEKPLTEEQIHTIVEAAQHASTSSYYQAYSIIGVTDQQLKKELAGISGQSYVEHNSHLFVFCADLRRLFLKANEKTREKMMENLQNTEHFIVATVDAALAAQNAAIAAESMELGICYIGSLRNNIAKVDELLELPEFVIPLFGMTVGYPDHNPEQKPRLPMKAIYFENKYEDNDAILEAELNEFNKRLEAYYQSRSENNRSDTFTDQVQRKLSNPIRMDVTNFVKKKGYNQK